MTWPNDEFLGEDFTMIRVWVESSGSQSAVLFGKSTVFPKLIRTWFEQDSNKCIKKHLKSREKPKYDISYLRFLFRDYYINQFLILLK